MSGISESVSLSGDENTSLRKVQLEYDDFYIRCNAVSTNLWFITIPNTKRINYEDDHNLINFIRPIFDETKEILIGNRLKEMQFDDVEDDYIFIGVISCENKNRTHTRVPTHLHILVNLRDGIINKSVVADRILCTLLNADTDRPVENYVSTRHKLLEQKELRRYYWVDNQRDKEQMFPDRNGGDPILNYSIFKSKRTMESWRNELDLRDISTISGFSAYIQIQVKPPLIKGNLIKRFLSPYGLKNNEGNMLPFTDKNVTEDLNRTIPFTI